MEQQGIYHQLTDPQLPPEPTPEDNKRANILCIISLACELLPILLNAVFSFFTSRLTELTEVDWDAVASSTPEIFSNILSALSLALMIAGLVIMIYVRVKYPKNVFGKVLMWLYIVLGILTIIFFIVSVLLIIWTCTSCLSCMQELG